MIDRENGLTLHPVSSEDLKQIETLVLRECDQQELIAATGLSPQEALRQSVLDAKEAWTILYDGRIEGFAGITESYSRQQRRCYGIPWLLATDQFKEFSLGLAKKVKRMLPELKAKYPLLMNFVDSRNAISIRWLEWLGFTIDRENPHYLHDQRVPFFKFYMN